MFESMRAQTHLLLTYSPREGVCCSSLGSQHSSVGGAVGVIHAVSSSRMLFGSLCAWYWTCLLTWAPAPAASRDEMSSRLAVRRLGWLVPGSKKVVSVAAAAGDAAGGDGVQKMRRRESLWTLQRR